MANRYRTFVVDHCLLPWELFLGVLRCTARLCLVIVLFITEEVESDN